MKLAMRVSVGMVGLFNVLLGIGFLFSPLKLAQQFALAPIGTQGLATLRADFPAFFLTGGVFALIGAWRVDPKHLRVPLALLGTALAGRFVGIVIDGTVPATFPPIIAEAFMILVLLAALQAFKPPRVLLHGAP